MYRKNTAGQHIGFGLVNATTGAALTGATVTVYRVIDNGSQATATGTVSEKGNGQYNFALSQADTNGDYISLTFTATNAIPVEKSIVATVLDPTATSFGLSLAKTTNITGFNDIAATAVVSGGAITTSGGAVSTVTTTATTTNLTNLPSIPANWLTAAGIAASALNGKGDWNVGKTGYSLTAGTGLGNQTADITGSLSGSVGSVTGSVGSVTAAVTVGTNNDKTGYSLTAGTGLGNQTANITGNLSGSVGSVTGSVGSVTGAVGSVTGSVGSIASGGITSASFAASSITAAALAADAGAEIADAVWDEPRSGHTTAGTFGLYLDAQVSTVGGGSLTAADIADAVWDEAIAGHLTSGSTGEALNAAGGSGDPWVTTLPGSYTGSQAGKILADILADTGTDGVVVAAGSKTGYSLTATTGLGNQTANITGNLSGSVGSVTGAVGSVTGNVGGNVVGSVASVTSGVTVLTNNDKTGYSLSTAPPTAAAIADAVWDEARSGHTTAGTFGLYLDAQVSTVGGGGLTAADIADAVWDEARSGHTTAGTFGEGVVAHTVSDKTGYSLSTAPPTAAAIADAVWDEAQSGHTTAGTFGLYLDGKISEVATGGVSVSAIADAVWDEARSGHTTAGTFGEALQTAAGAITTAASGTVTLPSPYTDGRAVGREIVVGGQARILASHSGSGVYALDSNWSSTPADGSDFWLGGRGAYSPTQTWAAATRTLTSDGLDSIVVETGMNARQALSIIAAPVAGVISGNDTTTATIKGAGVATTRIVATTDSSGNRSAVTLTLPS